MSAGPKQPPKRLRSSASPSAMGHWQAAFASKDAAPDGASPAKPGTAGRNASALQGAYYRQGVLVPGGLPNRPQSRGRSR